MRCLVHHAIMKTNTAGWIQEGKSITNPEQITRESLLNMRNKAVSLRCTVIFQTVREQLYAEERQWLEKQHKAPTHPRTETMFPLININVLPTQSSQPVIFYVLRWQHFRELLGVIPLIYLGFSKWLWRNTLVGNYHACKRRSSKIILKKR